MSGSLFPPNQHDIDQAKRFIMLAVTKQHPAVGTRIFWPRFTADILQLNRQEQDALELALKQLQAEGVFDENEGLTELGVTRIYGSDSARLEKAKMMLVTHLIAIRAEVGMKPNWHAFDDQPGPIMDDLAKAMKVLQEEGVMDANEALTPKGYQEIHKR